MIAAPEGPQPELRTERLVLRAFVADDAPAIQRILADRAIAAMTASIPHPYPDGMAEEWVQRNERIWAEGEGAVFAVTLAGTGELVAAMGVHLARPHDRAEVGYWVTPDHWNRGIATEAGRAAVAWAVPFYGLHRVEARCFAHNPASGAVLRRLGMRHEGTQRGQFKKWGEYVDVELYARLVTDPVEATDVAR